MDTKVYLMGLIISCPLNDAAKDCPLNQFRSSHITSLIEITNKIPIEDSVTIINHHKQCLKTRVACTVEDNFSKVG